MIILVGINKALFRGLKIQDNYYKIIQSNVRL